MPPKTVVLDANLLLLLVVGAASRSYIHAHKRLRAYAEEDYDLLLAFISGASRIVVTPNTATETSNLAGQIAEPARRLIFAALRLLLGSADEIYVESRRASEQGAFLRLGMTNSVLLDVLNPDNVLLTSDLDLYLEALRQGRTAENFMHHIAANR